MKTWYGAHWLLNLSRTVRIALSWHQMHHASPHLTFNNKTILQCPFAQWSKSFRDIIRLCLQKDPKSRPSCDDLLSHEHFSHLLDDEVLASCKARTKEKVCDVVGDVGSSSGKAGAYEGWVSLVSKLCYIL